MSRPNLTVLVVEDSPTDFELLHRVLLKVLDRDSHVTGVTRVADAIPELLLNHFDLIIMDLKLPDSEGLQTFHRISEVAEETPIVILSGTEDIELATEAVRNGAQDYVVKGSHAEVLGRIARFAVERSKRLVAENALIRARQDLKLAHEIQASFYPVTGPAIEGYDIEGKVKSAELACGDYFDFIERPDGKYTILIGDVSGHGLSAALYMLQARSCLHLLSDQLFQPAESLGAVNRTLQARSADPGRFMTLFLGVLDPQTKELRYASAGHQGYLLRENGDVEKLEPTTTVLGIMDFVNDQTEKAATLEAGDMIFVPTDGYEETANDTGELLGVDRLLRMVNQRRLSTAKCLLDELYDDVRCFGPSELLDDMTAIVIKATANKSQPVATA